MRAGARIGLAALVAALLPAPLLAQNSAEPASPVAIGPQPLESFSLKGTVTRQAEPVAPTRPAPQQAQPTAPRSAPQSPPASAQPAPQRPAASAERPQIPVAQAPIPEAALSAAFELPPVSPAGNPAAGGRPLAPPAVMPVPTPAPGTIADPTSAAGAALGEGPSISWLFAALLLALGAGYYFFRQRSRAAFAGANFDIVSPPAPVPAPAPPEPAPRPVPDQLKRTGTVSSSGGIVSTRLRPWLDIDFAPLRFILTEDKAVLEFEMSVQNSGAAAARDIRIEAALFTASPAQDEQLEAYFAHPEGVGSPIDSIQPLKRMSFTNQVVLDRDKLMLFQVDGKLMFVPVIGFTALYRWNGNNGQSSASYVVGRDTNGEKLGPLRADLGPRVFRNLGARTHTVGVRK